MHREKVGDDYEDAGKGWIESKDEMKIYEFFFFSPFTQNYYYILMLPLWRLENDWIHCNKAGQLDMVRKCL